jgi:hypothetical protein
MLKRSNSEYFDALSHFSQADQAQVRRRKSAQNALRIRLNASNNLCIQNLSKKDILGRSSDFSEIKCIKLEFFKGHVEMKL